MIILGIETSCDESAAAVVRNGREVLSSVVFSQVPLHQPYGGVVPEIASRSHVEKLPGVLTQALFHAGLGARRPDAGPSAQAALPPPAAVRLPPDAFDAIDAVAVTYGPGLASSLLVGLSAAKGLALRLGKPLIGINHIEAHIYSVFLTPGAPAPEDVFPFLALVVSGGHSCLVEVARIGAYRVIGQTLDDAAGEAFDKAAQLLGLGYPGGPAIDRAARQATTRDEQAFPQGRVRIGHERVTGALRPELCVSFSGLKTALMYRLRRQPASGPDEVAAIAAGYQEAIVGALSERCVRALRAGRYRALSVGGGVSLNARLRVRLQEVAAQQRVPLLLAEPRFCGDNAAMIAGLAGAGGGVRGPAAMGLDVAPSLTLGEGL